MPALDKQFENLFSDLNIKHKEKKNIFCDYCELIVKWNKKINLTAIDSHEDMMLKHIADSLSISDLIDGDKIADVGTGAGLPGVPLAIVHPNKNFLLINDSITTRTKFFYILYCHFYLRFEFAKNRRH